MKHCHFLAILLIFTFKSIGQISEMKAQEFVQVKKIDTCLIYSYHCGEGMPLIIPDSCEGNIHYLIWKEDKAYFLKQFKTCGDFQPVSLDISNPLSFYLSNKRTIDKQEIKRPTAYEVRKRGNKIDTLILTSTASHICYFKLEMRVNKNINEKFISTYDLNFKEFNKGQPNIYYHSNQKSQLKALIDKIGTSIKKISFVEN